MLRFIPNHRGKLSCNRIMTIDQNLLSIIVIIILRWSSDVPTYGWLVII